MTFTKHATYIKGTRGKAQEQPVATNVVDDGGNSHHGVCDEASALMMLTHEEWS